MAMLDNPKGRYHSDIVGCTGIPSSTQTASTRSVEPGATEPASIESEAPQHTRSEKLSREQPTVVSDDESEDHACRPHREAEESEGDKWSTEGQDINTRDRDDKDPPSPPRGHPPPPEVEFQRQESPSDPTSDTWSTLVTGHTIARQNTRRGSKRSNSAEHRSSPVIKDSFLTTPGPGKQPESPSLDLERTSPRHPEVIPLRHPKIIVPRRPKDIDIAERDIINRPDGPVQPGDPDFRRCFAQEQGQDWNKPLKCALHMNDVFGDFLTSEMEDGDHFWDLVVLTGEQNPWITTCCEYVTATWPDSVGAIQELFTLLERNVRHVQLEQRIIAHPSSDLTISTYRKSPDREGLDFSVTFDGVAAPQADMAEALTWHFSVLQQVTGRDGDSKLLAAVARWKRRERRRIGSSRYELTLHHLEPLIVPHTKACWTDLVPNTVSAAYFWTQERPLDVDGLEISFELLCFLAGLQYEVVEHGGVILYGKHSLVYPVRQHLGCVQWHFQRYHEDLTSRQFPFQIMRKRLLVDDLNLLCDQPRHFLGLWSDPHITLGTLGSERATVDWSNARELERETVFDGSTFGGTFSLPKVLTLTWSRTYKVARSRKNQYMAHFEADLHRMINTPVVLYSPSERRGWMVSLVSVLLHLARIRAELQKCLNYEIPPCERHGNGGQAAFDCLRACYRRPLKKAAPNELLSEEEQKFTVEDYVRDVLAAMELAKRECCRAKRFVFQTREQIIGFELADIARMKPQLRMKQHRLDGRAPSGWAPLLDEVQLVFFYEGVDDPIVPKDTSAFSGPCGRGIWHEIPKGYDLLAISLPCLINLAEHRNGGSTTLQRLTRDYNWHCPATLFEECKSRKKHRCSRRQELVVASEANSPNVYIRNDEEIRAVVFRHATGFTAITERERRLRARDNVAAGRLSIVPARQLARQATPDSGYSSRGSRQNMENALHRRRTSKAREASNALTKVQKRRPEGEREDALREDSQELGALHRAPTPPRAYERSNAAKVGAGRARGEREDTVRENNVSNARVKHGTTKKTPKTPLHPVRSSKPIGFLGFRFQR
ncbi:hypothetical protein AYL99_06771 [Fonsecaea erecta]|uniref:Uncharacterized protein n=1 Tax=Fonsecaea erecta TaxID=1367422 RepID=A0A178ZJV7_9EURO|nr:hypothetical protein AYL99_06771 [Fonsecaea erecta]OAP59473.1 hypothetical protein AYL99_06771 [Fonsecaea erecta]